MNISKKAVALCFMLLLFVGCGQKSDTPNLVYPFTCAVAVKGEGETVQGELTADLIGCYEFRVTSPELWQGLTFSCQNGQTTIGWGDFTYQVNESFPATSFFGGITSVLDQVTRREQADHTTKTTAVYNGTYEGGSFTAEIDSQNGRPLAICLGDGTQVAMEYE